MPDKEITPEIKGKFLEWCGLEQVYFENPFGGISAGVFYPDDVLEELIWLKDVLIDLNFLFKYALPKLRASGYIFTLDTTKFGNAYEVDIWMSGEPTFYIGSSKDPAVALFWAIWEVIKQEEPMNPEQQMEMVRNRIRTTMPPVHCESCYLHKPGTYTRKDCVTYSKRECAYEKMYIDNILNIDHNGNRLLEVRHPDQTLPASRWGHYIPNAGDVRGTFIPDEVKIALGDMAGWVRVIKRGE